MYEVAESSSDASLTTVQSTTGFSEVGDRGELAVDRACRIPPGVEGVAGLLSGVFVFEAGVDVTNEV